jgi:anti-sigma factor RsiW
VHNQGPQDDGHPVGHLEATVDEVTCHQFVELITDYFEGALPPRTLGQVEEHLVLCDWCVTYAEQMKATVDSVRMLRDRPSRTPSGSLLAALRARKAAAQ